MTPFPHLKQTSQEAGGTPGVKKFQRKLQMNFKEDFFLGHPVHFQVKPNERLYFHLLLIVMLLPSCFLVFTKK